MNAPFDPPPGLEIEIVEVDGATLAVFSWSRAAIATCLAVTLTDAERDVLEELCGGRSNAQIAVTRGTSKRTVANQVASLFRKFGVGSRHELIAKNK